MPNEPLIPEVPEVPPPSPRATRGYIKCDHCGCQLTQTGEVYRMSPDARTQLKSAETIAELNGTIETLRAKIEELQEKIPAPMPSPEPEPAPRRSSLLNL